MRIACIIIPTYNEAANIAPLIERIREESREHEGTAVHILVVDDHSPDGTAGVVRERMKDDTFLHLLERPQKNGLGAAYRDGMSFALSELSPDVVMEMDADFSHDPADIFRLLSADADFVIGSRYVPDGSVPEEWGLYRRWLSRGANAYARLVLRLPVRDCTAGFRAIRASVLRRIDLSSITAEGYVFQVALLDAALRSGASVAEVPVAFRPRRAGKSKMSLSEALRGAVGVVGLRPGLRQLITFGLVGAVGTVINTFILWVLHSVGLYFVFASAIATETAIVSNFIGNNLFTFPGRTKHRLWNRFLLFQGASLVTLVGTVGIVYLLTSLLGIGLLLVWNLVAIVLMFLVNFLFNRRYTWGV